MIKIEPGDILLYETSTIIGYLVRKISKFKYSHVALTVDNDNIIEANAFIKSRKIPFNKTKFKNITVMRPIIPFTDEQKQRLIEYSNTFLDRGYDYKGVFILFLKYVFRIDIRKIKGSEEKLWCSEMIYYIYNTTGINLVPEVSNGYITIEDIATSSALECIGTIEKI